MEELPEDKLQYEAVALLIEIQDLKGVTQTVVKSVVKRVNTLLESFLGVLEVRVFCFVLFFPMFLLSIFSFLFKMVKTSLY